VKCEMPVLVLGGGVAGLTAAEELARNGVRVLLLEKQGQVGGHAVRWACMATERCQKCSACVASDLKRRVLENPLVEVYTGGTLEGVTAEDGAVKARAVPAPENGHESEEGKGVREGRALREGLTWEVDAVFVAAGFETFPAEQKPMLHYRELEAVITTEDLDRVILEDRLGSLPSAGSPSPRAAFLQCIGSRDREAGRDYCSQVCCKNSLRLAARLLHERPEWAVTVFYIDLQVFGKGFREFYRALEGRIRVVQGVPSEVLPSAEGKLVSLVFEEPATGELKTEAFDLVVLAVGMLPPRDASALSGLLQVPLERRGFLRKTSGTNGSRFYTVGACRAPTDIPGARRQAMEAVGHYLARHRYSPSG
jgi:heterodisulfide reductase subunit A-like polyferredoxin